MMRLALALLLALLGLVWVSAKEDLPGLLRIRRQLLQTEDGNGTSGSNATSEADKFRLVAFFDLGEGAECLAVKKET